MPGFLERLSVCLASWADAGMLSLCDIGAEADTTHLSLQTPAPTLVLQLSWLWVPPSWNVARVPEGCPTPSRWRPCGRLGGQKVPR